MSPQTTTFEKRRVMKTKNHNISLGFPCKCPEITKLYAHSKTVELLLSKTCKLSQMQNWKNNLKLLNDIPQLVRFCIFWLGSFVLNKDNVDMKKLKQSIIWEEDMVI